MTHRTTDRSDGAYIHAQWTYESNGTMVTRTVYDFVLDGEYVSEEEYNEEMHRRKFHVKVTEMLDE